MHKVKRARRKALYDLSTHRRHCIRVRNHGVGRFGNSLRLYSSAAESASSEENEQSFAILGGGITGLATAYYLSKNFPKAKIHLFERSPTLGGWLRSKQVNVGDGKVVFEQGPRTLRPNGLNGSLTLQLVYL